MHKTAALFLSALAFCLLPAAGQAEIRIVSPAVEASSGELDNLFKRGAKLEIERRWGEAVVLYEEALREHPNAQALSGRHSLAKLHYDLGRRYGDSSFLKNLANLNERQALGLYSEVLLKIQSHYVAEPAWAALIERGTSSLEVALSEPSFTKRNRLSLDERRAAEFGAQLRKQLATRTIGNRQQAVDAVTLAARTAQQQLGLAPAAAILEYTCGATGALDEYSAYLTGDQLHDVYSQIEGAFVGLGIELKAADGGLLIVKVISGSPAQRGGLRAGQRIVAVGDRSTSELSTDQAADLLQGPEGSSVELTIIAPDQQTRRLTLRREHVDVPSVDEVRIVDRDYSIGYAKLTCFQKTTSRDLDNALWKLHREGMKSLILDLRGNPGGLLTSSVEVVDKFVEDGIIVSTRGRSTIEDYNYTAHKAGTWRVPLVVLIDGESASASEIFAGAIRDHHRGTIVGQRSYGKGSVQGIFPLSQISSGLRLTTAKFYSPAGRPISKVGVEPDVRVQRVAKPADGQLQLAGEEQDAILAAGIQAARQQVAKR